MSIFYVFLFAVALSTLFLSESSPASRGVVSAMLGTCLIGTIAMFLPQEWLEAIPQLRIGWAWRGRNLTPLLAVALGTAACYPLVTRCLYPLRDRLLHAFERKHGKGR